MSDDLPWPELGNVSRGATRGNQGQKGVLGPPDSEGRCLLQLRVQPGVLAVRLNRQASDWYRLLDSEVTRALKLTKTYWRKARRRQDYDARADQDHMELHEWLQQLKDKVMSHIELLMQKGEIQGPPYVMPDIVELSFLRKFVERQAAGIPHNPRLRRAYLHTSSSGSRPQQLPSHASPGTLTPLSGTGWEAADARDDEQEPIASSSGIATVDIDDIQGLMREMESSRTALAEARAEFSRARRETKEAFGRYTSCMDLEEKARQQVAAAEQRRDALTSRIMDMHRNQYAEDSSARPSTTEEQTHYPLYRPQSRESTGGSQDEHMSPLQNSMMLTDNNTAWRNMRDMHWPQTDAMGAPVAAQSSDMSMLERVSQSMNTPARSHEMQMATHLNPERKHARTWENMRAQEEFQDMTAFPPAKRQQVFSSASGALTSSLRQSTQSVMQVADSHRVDQAVGVMLNAPGSGAHLGNVPL
ncbi:uncharacterized protein FIBRA_01949 [Fibroporia radiculosa]|uniref:Uncharacterized protein n=1 Tax=Fibroporia radiculosa TaxID=599839 RepID=J4H1J5_9APHY|nr:uncharacterized protein FIBRA_01949 [Fibroporia radiculosa]CCL99924.1 predicted protein [Fibroporia radiculosa]